MTWTPPERPDWVLAFNDGPQTLATQEADQPLERDALIAEAAARQGRVFQTAAERDAAFGHPVHPAEPAFDVFGRFLKAIDEEASLNRMGRLLLRRFLLRVLEVRLQLMDTLRADPDLAGEEIRRPIFVAGAPRTGTTILHTLLAADPRHRVPLGWELLRPVPTPDPSQAATDPRIELADQELIAAQSVTRDLRSIHVFGGRKPKECLTAMSFAFLSEEFTTRFAVPRFAAWLEQADMKPAYQMHRLVLQILQRNQGPTQWVLKSPVHLHDLPTLFETYPDARVALTHRDPLTLLASLTSLVATLRWAHSDHVDPAAIAAQHLRRYARSFEQLVDWTEAGILPAEQIHHSTFARFQTDAIATVSDLYSRFGIQLESAAVDAMRAALAAHPADQNGKHVYRQEDLGGDPADLRALFARYQTTFNVPSDT